MPSFIFGYSRSVYREAKHNLPFKKSQFGFCCYTRKVWKIFRRKARKTFLINFHAVLASRCYFNINLCRALQKRSTVQIIMNYLLLKKKINSFNILLFQKLKFLFKTLTQIIFYCITQRRDETQLCNF